jgi:hypothetical protein
MGASLEWLARREAPAEPASDGAQHQPDPRAVQCEEIGTLRQPSGEQLQAR